MATNQQSDVPPSVRVIRAGIAWVAAHALLLIALAILATLAVVLCRGFYVVHAGETASLRRFGHVVGVDKTPGLHWILPFGIDRVDVRETSKIRRIEIAGQSAPNLSMLTGDVNFANARLAIQYDISD
ncbi:MAG: hypothetical protein ACREKL_06345, partial [Chthoniobacterales bacterium]